MKPNSRKSAALQVLPFMFGGILVVALIATVQMRAALGLTPTPSQYLIPSLVGLVVGALLGCGYLRLKARQSELNQFFELSIDMLCIANVDGKFLRLNPSFQKVLGWSTDEMLGKPFTEFIHPNDVEETLAKVNKRNAGDPAIQFENRYLCKGGSYKWLNWTAHSTPEGLLYSVAHDVTARKQMEESLRDSSLQLRAIVDTAVDGIITIDENGIIETANPAAERIFGYHNAEIIGHNVKMLMPSPYQDEHDRYVSNYLQTGQRKIIGIGRQVEGLRKDGTSFPLELAVAESELNDRLMFTGIVRDVTQRVEQEEILRQSEARNRALLDIIPDAIMRIHRDGTTLDVKAPSNYQSISPDGSVVGMKQRDTLPPSLANRVMASITKALDTTELQILEYEADIQGTKNIREARIIPSDQDEAIVMIRDVTEQRELEQAKQAAVLAERDRIARDLHDSVTQTLFSARLIADVLPTMWDRNPERAKIRLEELRELSRGALAEMRTLLLELRPKVLMEADLAELLQQLVDALIGRARVQAELVIEGDVHNLPEDLHVAIYRTIQEALNNIAKHAQASNVSVTVQRENSNLQIIVQDDGRGFDPSTPKGGHFGLQNMHERIASIGGTLTINSQPEQGTQVFINTQLFNTQLSGTTTLE